MAGDDWGEYRLYVTETLKDINATLKDMNKDITTLKVKAGIWGFLAGIIPSALAQLWHLK